MSDTVSGPSGSGESSSSSSEASVDAGQSTASGSSASESSASVESAPSESTTETSSTTPVQAETERAAPSTADAQAFSMPYARWAGKEIEARPTEALNKAANEKTTNEKASSSDKNSREERRDRFWERRADPGPGRGIVTMEELRNLEDSRATPAPSLDLRGGYTSNDKDERKKEEKIEHIKERLTLAHEEFERDFNRSR